MLRFAAGNPSDSRPNPQRFRAIITRTKQSWDLGKEGGGGRTQGWERASGDWHSTHATRGKRRRFAPPFPPSCIRRGFISGSIFRVSSALGQAGVADRKYSAASAGPGNCGPTYSAIVGATIVFDFWKIIIRGLPILGWIRLLEPCDISRPATPAIRDKYYANKAKLGFGQRGRRREGEALGTGYR